MDKVNLIIDGKKVTAEKGATILQVARDNNIFIPTLCYLKDIIQSANCRICVVEIVGRKNLVCACNTTVYEGMDVKTNSPAIVQSRVKTLRLMISSHHKDCANCAKVGYCQLQKLCVMYNIPDTTYVGKKNKYEIDESSPCIIRNNNKCILCGRCIEVCGQVQNVYALTKAKRGFDSHIACGYKTDLGSSTCVGCGQCTLVCPTAALMENGSVDKVKTLLKDKSVVTIAQIAPSVRVSFMEEFGAEIGTFNESKLVGCLRLLGFNKIFDINMGADFTVVEEARELVDRIKENKHLPQFSSCCPGWFKYVQNNYKEYEKNLSSCKSPSEMLGTVVKNYYAKAKGITNLKVVAIMPCTAKKGEIERAEDVDAVITTRELARMVREAKIDVAAIGEEKFDSPLGTYSGAGLIFGVTGGVTEAVLRTASEIITGKDLSNMDFTEVRYSKGIKEVSLTVDKMKLKIAIVNGLANANKVMQQIKSGKKSYHFIEVMACPGGCINGGGQPYVNYSKVDLSEVIAKRSAAIYNADKQLKNRQSHKNVSVTKVYQDFFLQEEGLSKKLLHYRSDD